MEQDGPLSVMVIWRIWVEGFQLLLYVSVRHQDALENASVQWKGRGPRVLVRFAQDLGGNAVEQALPQILSGLYVDLKLIWQARL